MTIINEATTRGDQRDSLLVDLNRSLEKAGFHCRSDLAFKNRYVAHVGQVKQAFALGISRSCDPALLSAARVSPSYQRYTDAP